ncbi:MAG TPA: cation diffusion facilitator family transporter [Rhizomicrobium sp.]|nr:cation diffusion facilitator family transporter [Rhizomicrobium sp.]
MSGQHHHDHEHGPSDGARLTIALAITLVFLAVEVAGGLLAGSLALLADAGHMVSDAGALAMSLAALRLGARAPDKSRSYGYRRLEVLAAFVNAIVLVAISVWIVVEAVRRFASPEPVIGGTMLVVAIAGLLANLAAFAVLHGGGRENLNLRSAVLHALGDLAGFAMTILAALIIMYTGFYAADPILSILVALLILRGALGILRDSGHILLEGTPHAIDPDDVRDELKAVLPGEADVHHIHVWAIGAGQTVATLHVGGLDEGRADAAILAIKQRLKQRYGISHSTIQVEPGACADR